MINATQVWLTINLNLFTQNGTFWSCRTMSIRRLSTVRAMSIRRLRTVRAMSIRRLRLFFPNY